MAIVDRAEIDEAWLESLNEMDEFDRMGSIFLRVKELQAGDFPRLLDSLAEAGPNGNWLVRSISANAC